MARRLGWDRRQQRDSAYLRKQLYLGTARIQLSRVQSTQRLILASFSSTQASVVESSRTIPRLRCEMSLSPSRVASISIDATRRSSSHKQKGKGSVSLETHERLNIPSGTPNRRHQLHGSLKPTSAKPIQTRTHTKPPTIHVKKRKDEHHTEEHYKQTIVLQQTVIEALRAQISERPHQCPKCSKSCKRSDHVRSHIRIKHPELAPSLDETYCEKCEKRFARPVYLAQHTCVPNSRSEYAALTWIILILTCFLSVTLPATRLLRCEQCQVDLSTSTSLSRHLKTKRHREVVGQSMNQDLGLVPQEGASSPRKLFKPD